MLPDILARRKVVAKVSLVSTIEEGIKRERPSEEASEFKCLRMNKAKSKESIPSE
jgi:hypothetical protein